MAYNWGKPTQSRFYCSPSQSPVAFDLYWRNRNEKERAFLDKLHTKQKEKLAAADPAVFNQRLDLNAERSFVASLKQSSMPVVPQLREPLGSTSLSQIRDAQVRQTWPPPGDNGSAVNYLSHASPMNAKASVYARQPPLQQLVEETSPRGKDRRHLPKSKSVPPPPPPVQPGRADSGGSDVDDAEIQRLRGELEKLQRVYKKEKEKRAQAKQRKVEEKRRLLNELSVMHSKLDTIRGR